MRKMFKIVPDSIFKKSKKKSPGRRNPTGRTTTKHLFVEDVLADIGKCCGVDLCGNRLIIPNTDCTATTWGTLQVTNGTAVFGTIDLTADGEARKYSKQEWRVQSDSIVEEDKSALPLFRRTVNFVEDILNAQGSCCGVNCAQGGFTLPDWTGGNFVTFDFDGSVVSTTPIPADHRRALKKRFKILPDSIYRRKSKSQRTGSPRIRESVEYFEDLQYEMVTKYKHRGFDCCAGRIILDDTANGNVYELTPVDSGGYSLLVSELDPCTLEPIQPE